MELLNKFKEEHKGWFRFDLAILAWFVINLIILLTDLNAYENPAMSKEDVSQFMILGWTYRFATVFIITNSIIVLFEKTAAINFKNRYPKWFWMNIITIASSINTVMLNRLYAELYRMLGHPELYGDFYAMYKDGFLGALGIFAISNIIVGPIAIISEKIKRKKSPESTEETN